MKCRKDILVSMIYGKPMFLMWLKKVTQKGSGTFNTNRFHKSKKAHRQIACGLSNEQWLR